MEQKLYEIMEHACTGEPNKLIDEVNEGFKYFNGYRLEELKKDDVHYINSFMKYIESLEVYVRKFKRLNEALEQQGFELTDK